MPESDVNKGARDLPREEKGEKLGMIKVRCYYR